jgi:ubiquinone/menaquinone biosynthesis C-methylase UbiE
MSDTESEVSKQRRYYAETAQSYEAMHGDGGEEHAFALSFLLGAISYVQADSVLDIGAGTGRTLLQLKEKYPALKVTGVEPVKELRSIGYEKGLLETELLDGDATRLAFPENHFDIVCEFAVLHHVRRPEVVIREMFRVARKAVFISDSNNFGQGSLLTRTIKQALDTVKLWPLADLLKTRGRGYTISEGDGIAYSYSVFNNYDLIRGLSRAVHVVNTLGAGLNPYRTAPHVGLLAIK